MGRDAREVAAEIVSRVSALDAARAYGLEFDRAGFARCPFHTEKTASFKIEPDGKFGHCFGCGRNATAIAITMQLLGLDFWDAARRLSADFALGLDVEQKPNLAAQQARQRSRRERLRREDELRRLREEYWAALGVWRAYEQWRDAFRPASPDCVDRRYAEAVKNIDAAAHRLDTLEALIRKEAEA